MHLFWLQLPPPPPSSLTWRSLEKSSVFSHRTIHLPLIPWRTFSQLSRHLSLQPTCSQVPLGKAGAMPIQRPWGKVWSSGDFQRLCSQNGSSSPKVETMKTWFETTKPPPKCGAFVCVLYFQCQLYTFYVPLALQGKFPQVISTSRT